MSQSCGQEGETVPRPYFAGSSPLHLTTGGTRLRAAGGLPAGSVRTLDAAVDVVARSDRPARPMRAMIAPLVTSARTWHCRGLIIPSR